MNSEEKHRALFEMAQTPGWREVLAPKLQEDYDFVMGLVLGQPGTKEVGHDEKKIRELVFRVKDLPEYRYAHGIAVEAKKILHYVNIACEKIKKQ